jgi:hypothetical protein
MPEGGGAVTQPGMPNVDADNRRKHLDYIQANVARMSAASSAAKGWLLPVVTEAYGFALTKKEYSIALLGIAAVLLFSLLDANYLRQEKGYRRLYDAVARRTREVPLFSLDPADAQNTPPPATTLGAKARQGLGRWLPNGDVWLSWSIAPFYGGLTAMGLIVVIVAR